MIKYVLLKRTLNGKDNTTLHSIIDGGQSLLAARLVVFQVLVVRVVREPDQTEFLETLSPLAIRRAVQQGLDYFRLELACEYINTI